MVRKAFFALAPMQVGLLLAYLLNDTAVLPMLFILGGAALSAIPAKRFRGYILFSAVSFAAGVIISLSYTNNVYDKTIAFDGENVLVEGFVYDKKEYSESSHRIDIKGRINGEADALISFYITPEQYKTLTYGDGIAVFGKVNRISDKLGFGNESFNKSNSVFLKGGKVERLELTGENSHPVYSFAKRLRDYASKTLNEYGGSGGQYLSAILCGERGILDDTDREAFYRIGIGHIFAFSGTHVAIILGLMSAVLSMFTGRRWVHFLSSALLGILLVMFSGLSVSAIRAVIMMTSLQLSKLAKRPADPLTSLSLASAVLTVISPYCIASYSYILTMAGSFACSVYADHLSERISVFKDRPLSPHERTIITVFSASVVLFGISAFMFGEVSVISPLSNLLLVPVCTFSMSVSILGLILSPVSSLLSGYIIWLSGLCMRGCALLSSLISRIPFTNINVWHSEVRAVIIALIAIPCIAWFTVKRGRTLIIAYCAAMAGIISASLITRVIYRDKIYLAVFSYGGANVLIYDEDTSLAAFTGSGGSAELFDRLSLMRGADGAQYALCSEKAAGKLKASYGDHLFVNSSTRYSDTLISCKLGDVSLDENRINYKLDTFGVVISPEMVYNKMDDEMTDISQYPAEIELDTKTGELKVRRLDYGFDYSG